MELTWGVDHRDGISLVSVQLTNESKVDRRVRLDNRLDGPVLPPRRQGVPESGWDGDGYETVVPAGTAASVGYACPADAKEPPVELVSTGRVGESDPPVTPGATATAEGALRRCGAARPPRDAVGAVGSVAAVGSDVGDRGDGDENRDGNTDDSGGAASGNGTGDDQTELPQAVDAWFAEVRERVEHAEALTGASVADATTVLQERGGLAAVERLPARLERDAAALRALARDAERLADRAESTDVPVDALGRLA